MLYGTEGAVQCSSAGLYSVVCCSEVLCSPAQLCSEVLNGAVRHPAQLYGTGQCYMELYSAAWGCMVLCSAVQWTVLHYLQCHTTVVGCCRMLYSAAQCCTVLQDISQCYTRWYSAVNVQCCATYSATQSCTQCCRMLYSVTGHFTMLHKVVQCCKCTLLRYLQCYTTLWGAVGCCTALHDVVQRSTHSPDSGILLGNLILLLSAFNR